MNKTINLLVLILIVTHLISCSNSNKSSEKRINSNTTKLANTQSKQFNSDAFFQAAFDGNKAYIEKILLEGIDVNQRNTENRTALMLAAFNGHSEIVKVLLEKGANVNLVDNINRTALMFASTGPFNATVKLLLQYGAEPNIADAEENWTAVMFAAGEGQLEVIKTLAANGADLSMVDIDGESCVDFAVSKGHTEVANYLQSQK